MSGRADLHLHTTASDGFWTPQQLVQQAKAAALTTIAVTDHDTVDGVAPAVEAGRQMDIDVIPGIELSVTAPAGEVHLLGYFINPDEARLRRTLTRLQQGRQNRLHRIVAVLQQMGFGVTAEEVEELVGDGVAGRPHIARVLVEKGYVPDVNTAFSQLLAEGRPAYVARPKLSLAEGIALLHAAGGLAVCAHPKLLPDQNLLGELVRLGLDGVEVVHSSHDVATQQHYKHFARAHDLLMTGGSDCHGPGIKKELYIGRFFIGDRWVTAMKKRYMETNHI